MSAINTDIKQRMEKTLHALKESFVKIRTSRAHPSLLEQVMVNCYGSELPLAQVATIHASDAQTLTVTPFDKSITSQIEKAIRIADLGLNPANSGTVIRVPMPPLNEERRKEFVKLAKTEAENARVSVRNIRRDANDQIKKNKELSEDEKTKSENEIQKLTDHHIKEIDKILAEKEKDLLDV